MSDADRTSTRPALVVLHGHDSTAAEAEHLAAAIDPDGRFHHVAPTGPYETASGGREWFSTIPGSLAQTRLMLSALLADLVARVPVVVVGYSQGGAAALATLASTDAPIVSAVACISGYLGEEPGTEPDLSQLRPSPVLLQHGRSDEVVPHFMATDLAAALEHAGVDVTAQWFDLAHERGDESLAALRAWIDALELS